jgi:hypothetical protein
MPNPNANMNAPFPLTPALSLGALGERENRLPRFRQSGAFRLVAARSAAFPLPEGEGQGEGERDARNQASRPNLAGSTWLAPSVANVRRPHWPAVIRQRMRSALLQRPPNRVADGVFLAPQTGVPESKHLDATRCQKSIAFDVLGLLLRRAVLQAVRFNVHPSIQTEEVKDVRPERMLTAKFVAGEPPLAQPTPEKFLGPRVLLAQHACDARELGRCHAPRVGWLQTRTQARWFTERFFPLPLTLSLGALGEREHRMPRCDNSEIPGKLDTRRTLLLLPKGPKGEGRGEEGERDYRILNRL